MPTDYQYTGQLSQMAEIGLYHYGARFYDPALSHFISADTMVPSAGNVRDFNRFAYGRNNPLYYTDPSGHAAICFDCGGSSLEKTLESFTKYGKHGNLFNEFYAQVYYAEAAMANSLGDGVIDEKDLITLKAHEDAIKTTYHRALNFVTPKNLTASMFDYTQSSIVSRALGIAPSVEGHVIAYPKAINEKAEASPNYPLETAFAVVIFGHGARHLYGLGLEIAEVETAMLAEQHCARAAQRSTSLRC